MKDSNYVNICGWMINRLKLKGNDLILFAIIYGFCQDGESEFKGSLNYISDALSCSRPTSIKSVNNLIEKGYLKKRVEVVNNVTFNRYSIPLGVVKNLYMGSKEPLPNNTKDISINNTIEMDPLKMTLGNVSSITGKPEKKATEKDYKTEREILRKVHHLFDPKYFNTEAKKKKWLEEIRKLIEVDKEKPDTIISVITFGRENDFWNKNFLSVLALRKKNKEEITKYDSIKANIPEHKQPVSNIQYKNGIRSATEAEIRQALFDEATYQINVIENRYKYVNVDGSILRLREENGEKFVFTPKGKIKI